MSRWLTALSLCGVLAAPAVFAQPKQSWPDLTSVAPIKGGGENDAAVLIGIDSYAFLKEIPGAVRNVEDWSGYLIKGRKVPEKRVSLLLNKDATKEKILKAVRDQAKEVKPNGTLWVVFVGHGALDGSSQYLQGVDTQDNPDSVVARGISKKALLQELKSGKQSTSIVLLDTAFSKSSGELESSVVDLMQPSLMIQNETLDDPKNRTLMLTAGSGEQFFGLLPGGSRPAFSYLILGGVRGWADLNSDSMVTAREILQYGVDSMQALIGSMVDEAVAAEESSSESGTESQPANKNLAEKLPDTPGVGKNPLLAMANGDEEASAGAGSTASSAGGSGGGSKGAAPVEAKKPSGKAPKAAVAAQDAAFEEEKPRGGGGGAAKKKEEAKKGLEELQAKLEEKKLEDEAAAANAAASQPASLPIVKSELVFKTAVIPKEPDGTLRPNEDPDKASKKVDALVEKVRSLDDDETSTPEDKMKAWCALAAEAAKNPYLENAKKGCKSWTDFNVKFGKASENMRKDLDVLLEYVDKKQKNSAEKMAALNEFIKAYNGLAKTPQLRGVMSAQKAMSIGKPIRTGGANPPGRFIDMEEEGIVIDKETGLMWSKRDSGLDMTFGSAKNYCDDYKAGSFSDWRMPTSEELRTLYSGKSGYIPQCGLESEFLTSVFAFEGVNLSCYFVWSDAGGTGFGFEEGRESIIPAEDSKHTRALPVRKIDDADIEGFLEQLNSGKTKGKTKGKSKSKAR